MTGREEVLAPCALSSEPKALLILLRKVAMTSYHKSAAPSPLSQSSLFNKPLMNLFLRPSV